MYSGKPLVFARFLFYLEVTPCTTTFLPLPLLISKIRPCSDSILHWTPFERTMRTASSAACLPFHVFMLSCIFSPNILNYVHFLPNNFLLVCQPSPLPARQMSAVSPRAVPYTTFGNRLTMLSSWTPINHLAYRPSWYWPDFPAVHPLPPITPPPAQQKVAKRTPPPLGPT